MATVIDFVTRKKLLEEQIMDEPVAGVDAIINRRGEIAFEVHWEKQDDLKRLLQDMLKEIESGGLDDDEA